MAERRGRNRIASGNPWSAGCSETGTSGAEGGPGKRAGRDPGTAPRPDPYTKLAGPRRGSWFDLYVILDIFSRYVVGWTVAAAESGELAAALIADAIGVHGEPKAIHADRGTSMTSKPVTQLLLDLGVARSHSRPHVSNDCDDLWHMPSRAGSDPSQRPAPCLRVDLSARVRDGVLARRPGEQ